MFFPFFAAFLLSCVVGCAAQAAAMPSDEPPTVARAVAVCGDGPGAKTVTVHVDAPDGHAGNYMVIAFDLESKPSSGATWVYLDNIKVEEVPPCPSGDLDSDCLVDMKDLRILAADWLACSRTPSGQCWQ